MTIENQDPQVPTEDQPPVKQYAGQQRGQSGELGTDERKPNLPTDVESSEDVDSSEGDDETSTAAEQNAEFGGTGTGSGDGWGKGRSDRERGA